MLAGFRPRHCSVAAHKMVYYRAGQGESVLLVHGITTYSFIWRQLFDTLARDYDVIAVDLLGCGNSAHDPDLSYALSDHADYLLEFVTQLNLPRFHYVGHDLGGGIGQIFAVRHPEKLLDLALLNTVAYDFWPVQPITALRTPIVRQLLMATLDRGMMRLVVKRGIYHEDRVTPELMSLFLAPFGTAAGRRAFLRFARDLDNHNLMDIAADLRRLDLPVLVMRGENDPYLSQEIAQRLARETPDSRLLLLPEAGHFAQEDAPEQIHQALTGFFEERNA